MGVTGLWSILDELKLCEERDLSFLAGKRVAVDLSGWVVQAIKCKGLNTTKNPHLRNLFFRVSSLLRNDVHPIFILEGKVPDLKDATFKQRNHHGKYESDNVSRAMFDRVLEQCHDILQTLGVPCIKSQSEAEALCAFLCVNEIVDAVITEDSDALLYGADPVLTEFTIDQKGRPHIKMFSLKAFTNKIFLDRSKLIALALLLGCDYVKGVPGIGKESALKLVTELQDCDILQRFRNWKKMEESELFPGYNSEVQKKGVHCTRCNHSGSSSKHKKEGCKMCNSEIICYLADPENPCSCGWHKNCEIALSRKNELKVYNAVKNIPDFPNTKVIEEYLNYTDIIPEEDMLEWKCPNLKKFQEKMLHYLGWTFANSFEKLLPIITLWQQLKLIQNIPIENSKFLYKPIKVLKQRIQGGEPCLEIQWTANECYKDDDIESGDLCTKENEERFRKSYPEISSEFYNSLKIKEQSKAKLKTKALSPSPKKKKLTDYFAVDKMVNTRGNSRKDNVNYEDGKKRNFNEVADIEGLNSKKQCQAL